MPSSRRRLWFFRFTMLVLPFVLLGVLEISLRLGGFGYNPQVFKRLKIVGEEFFVHNEEFSPRFFPNEIARNPGPILFRVQKAPGTFRIFILRVSTALGAPPL